MERPVYRPLTPRRIRGVTYASQPSTYSRVRADTPAIEVMTDLRSVSVATIGPDATLAEATRVMISRGVRLLLVSNASGEMLGLITARDTMGERPIKLLHDRGGRHGDLHVSDLMRATEEVDVFDLADVLRSEVGHIVATLKELGRQHALVVERDPVTGGELVRGIFSATQIGRQLGVAVQTFEVAHTFAEIEAAVARG